MRAVDGVQVAGGGQLGRELTPGHLEDLVGDVSLDYLDKVLHLVSVELQLTELHRATGAFHQRCGDKTKSRPLLMGNSRPTALYTCHIKLIFKSLFFIPYSSGADSHD